MLCCLVGKGSIFKGKSANCGVDRISVKQERFAGLLLRVMQRRLEVAVFGVEGHRFLRTELRISN